MAVKTLRGHAWTFGDDINTDFIYPGKYFALYLTDLKEIGSHAMEGIDPEFSAKVTEGDFIVAGKNFGSGSLREEAPLTLKGCGIAAVIAESFNRSFYRNSINIGLPILICENVLSEVKQGDDIEVDLAAGEVRNLRSNTVLRAKPFPELAQEISAAGGLVPYMKEIGEL